jgi:hypothetical protein
MMKNYKNINNLVGWLVFGIATIVYFLTLEPTASWWDCGEYISTAYKLQVGHPPGAPLFQLIGRFFTLFAFGNVANVALMINIMSALSSSFTILFLFWTITMLAKKLVTKSFDEEISQANGWAVLGAGVVGALAYTFSDSFWFSAVEGEVYAMSSFLTAVVFWAILRWEEVAHKRLGFRWILLISYIVGLSIGVHLLNLLAIPAIVYVYYFKKYKFSPKGFFAAGLISLAILSLIMYVVIPWTVNLAGKTELAFVNGLGLPFNSGTIFYFLLIVGLVAFGLYFSQKKGKVILNASILALTFILIGYSSFFILIIRANANTPINENDPKDALSMLSYLNREQYGSWPLAYGQYYNAPAVGSEDGSPVYMKDKKTGKYIIKDDRKGTKAVYDKRLTGVFPRMWSNQKPSHATIYKRYGGSKGTPVSIAKEDGTSEVIYKPTFGENLKFFFSYQINHMYLRYLMWNFVGRQNDIEGQGEIQNGNWISGISFLDEMRLGDQTNLPASMKNPARATFFFLPLILGIVGFVFQLKKSKKDTWVVFLLFIMTGLAIVVYLNQSPFQPRERDYAYAGSFYAFAIWIGLGVLSLFDGLKKVMTNKKMAAVIVTLASLLLVPTIMATQGWKAHDRSGKYAAVDFAKMYLASCAPNAILFTNGDNDTFPLWYAQEVEGFRTDVRVVNYMLSSGDWYVNQMGKKVYDSERLPLSIPSELYQMGDQNYMPVFARIDKRTSVQEAVNFVKNEDKRSKIQLQNGSFINYLPVKKLTLKIDSAQAIKTGTVDIKDADKIVDYINWDIKQNGLYRNDLMLLDLIATNNWERPIYFANPYTIKKVFDVDKYCHLEGVAYRLKPYPAANYMDRVGGVDSERSYEVLMDENVRWGRLNEDDVNIDRESSRNSTMAKQNYLRLAQTLVEENKNEKAILALDRGLEFFPTDKFTTDYFTIPWIGVYYEADANDKANDLAQDVMKNALDNLGYYNSLKPKFQDAYHEEYRMELGTLQALGQVVREYNQIEFANSIDSVFYEEVGKLNLK